MIICVIIHIKPNKRERESDRSSFRPFAGAQIHRTKNVSSVRRSLPPWRESVFVSNFPEDWNEKDIFEWLRRYGKIVNIHIPKKRTKKGRTFAFVDFIGESNIGSLANDIDKMWIGLRKIRANVARPKTNGGNVFVDRKGIQNVAKVVRAKAGGGNNRNLRIPDGLNGRRDNRKFAEVVKFNGGKQDGDLKRIENLESPETHLICSTEEKVLAWADSCLVGESELPLSSIRDEINAGGYNGVLVSSLGQKRFIIHSNHPNSLERLKKEDDVWKGKIFSSLRRWVRSDVVSCRSVWINVFGLPYHLWSFESFKSIGSSLRSFIEVDQTVGFYMNDNTNNHAYTITTNII
ncbi:Splicing factor [Castilleja foliolosa]|uniref:Splicing factor n=1 Tax=Castilleja foliolosa TaxID=1961234 RepID=A0ABD3B8I1_9LAMI